MPSRIVWQSGVEQSENLLKDGKEFCVFRKKVSSGTCPAVLLDFGFELNGGISIETGIDARDWFHKIRIRFGESVSEAMGQPNNDHSIHDTELTISALGKHEFGCTGFRFVRIDLLSETKLHVHNIKAVALERPLEYKGRFECSDDMLNRIWKTGARTVHLCCQDYLLDGIKRDRLVWVGDIHPQLAVIAFVFGRQDIVTESLDYIYNRTVPDIWMNGIGSYNLWWLISLYNWYWLIGDLKILTNRVSSVKIVFDGISNFIDKNGKENTGGMRFIDWALGIKNEHELGCGLQSLTVWAVRCSKQIFEAAGEYEYAKKADNLLKLTSQAECNPKSKQAAALKVLAGTADSISINNEILSAEPAKGLSTWFGYYVLQARAQADDFAGCIDLIRNYWGGMLKLGATTFWEHFDLDWLKNGGRIDEAVQADKIDVHLNYGDHCYKGLRHSLCHGWAAGPTAWLPRHVLGIEPLKPGYAEIQIKPWLGGLEWAKGNIPTEFGNIEVEHFKNEKGHIVTNVKTPDEIKVIENGKRKNEFKSKIPYSTITPKARQSTLQFLDG
ncbi:MAG: hypothetical protein A2Y10_16435 [Planctomycetes bacterium GWF2_41_51]|nr:MAG: hypothetical protein A2Y10_16435 [Planctomycetes bacterium GWF2_41_51]